MATAGNSIVDTEAMQKLIAKVKKSDASIVAQLESHVSDSGNPHQVTAHQVGAYTQQETDDRVLRMQYRGGGRLKFWRGYPLPTT